MDRKQFEICVRVKKETLKAILVSDGTIEVWLAKSQIKFLTRYNKLREVLISMPEKLAREKKFL